MLWFVGIVGLSRVGRFLFEFPAALKPHDNYTLLLIHLYAIQ